MISLPSIATAKDALSILGQITDLTKAAMTLELKEKIIELRETLLAQKEETVLLREQIAELKNRNQLREQLKFEYPNYYSISESGQKDGPFCKSCKDNSEKLIRLSVRQINTAWYCDVCNTYFTSETSGNSPQVANVKSGWDYFDN